MNGGVRTRSCASQPPSDRKTHALKIPARRAEYSLTENVASPFHAEPRHLLSYWKARHILWWSAIEALFGNSEDAAMARIYALFGNKDDVEGYRCPIYEKGDIPSFYFPTKETLHTLGEVVPHIYTVRNQSAHGQKVSDFYFTPAPHPFGHAVVWLEVLAEA